jgi:N-acetylglucosaminyldiphosphoundecaprenol N-acetyl-beta-D-mannosaminyltransferase
VISSGLHPPPTRQISTADALDVAFFAGDLDEAAETVLERVAAGGGGYACLCGVHGLMLARHRPSMMAALHGAWMTFPDGAPVAWLMRRTGCAAARRVAGPDLMPRLIELGQPLAVRHFFLGSTPEVLDRLRERVEQRCPDAVVAGMCSPPFRELSPDEARALVDEIAAAAPDVVWVGLGLPKQDEWMHRHATELRPAVVLGVGAAFDFEAQTKRRAPRFMQRLGLEWLHRLASEPRRLARRYATTNSEFMLRAGVAVAAVWVRRSVAWASRQGRT